MGVSAPSDRELRDIVYQFEETSDYCPYPAIPDMPPLLLTAGQVERVMTILGDPRRRNVEKELREAAKYFPNALWTQDNPAPSHVQRKIKEIQNRALALRESFENIQSLQMKMSVFSFLRQGVEIYRDTLASEHNIAALNLPWNFWTAHKLPSTIAAIEMLEHLAGLASVTLDRIIRQDALQRRGRRNSGRTAARVLIMNLALAWLHTKGCWPFAGPDTYVRTRNARFMKFCRTFLAETKTLVTDVHRSYLPNIDRELTLNGPAIQGHLNRLKRIVAHYAKEESAAKAGKGSVIPRVVRFGKRRR